MSLVFLIGMPGAGKSYWGRQIARNFVVPFHDLDKYIIHQEQSTIADLFQKHGEEWFRLKEHGYLKKLIGEAKPDTVIACGGGTPCFHDNMPLMNQSGITIYLEANPRVLIKNMHYSLEMRPLLRDKEDIATFLAGMLEQRAPFYRLAQHILQTEYISLATFGQII
jgi:shikimate kinase